MGDQQLAVDTATSRGNPFKQTEAITLQRAEAGDFGVGHRGGGESSGEAFQRFADMQDFRQVFQRELGDPHADVRRAHQQLAALQLADRLAQRPPADPERSGQRLLGKLRPRLQRAGDDRRLDTLGHDIDQRLRLHFAIQHAAHGSFQLRPPMPQAAAEG